MNILVLAAGSATFDSHDGSYPLCLTEFDGVPLIEKQITACQIGGDAKFIVAFRGQDIQRFHLDNVVRLLAPDAVVINVPAETRGAACTALLAVGCIDNGDELLILNGDEVLDLDFSVALADFRRRNLDCGVVTFPSVHPRYSYIRLGSDNFVVEAAEKNPISRFATAGFYWFARGGDFVKAAQNMIRKNATVNDLFYICPSLNELVLEQLKIGIYKMDARCYHPLKTERQFQQYNSAAEWGKAK